MITIKNIANKLGVSISTVSKGLNGASDISEDMRQQVLDTAIELGYRFKGSKKSMKHKVCIIVENMEYANINQFGYELITGFRLMASEQDYEVDILPMDLHMQSNMSYDQRMRHDNYSGAFFLGFEMDDVYMDELKHTQIPTVLFDNYVPNKQVAYVGTDYKIGIKSLIRHLYDNGHRRIALLNGSINSYISNVRSQEIIKELELYGIHVDDSMIDYCINFTPETAKDCIPKFIKNNVTAIICASDLIAAVTINELRCLGIRVPDDISVTGLDDLPISKYLIPPLTTIRQERFTLGKLAFTLLSKIIDGIPVSTTLLHSELIIRESVKNISGEIK